MTSPFNRLKQCSTFCNSCFQLFGSEAERVGYMKWPGREDMAQMFDEPGKYATVLDKVVYDRDYNIEFIKEIDSDQVDGEDPRRKTRRYVRDDRTILVDIGETSAQYDVVSRCDCGAPSCDDEKHLRPHDVIDTDKWFPMFLQNMWLAMHERRDLEVTAGKKEFVYSFVNAFHERVGNGHAINLAMKDAVNASCELVEQEETEEMTEPNTVPA